jgi:hypothetical protein
MTAWVVVEASRALLEDLELTRLHGYVWVAAALGLPVAAALSWLFEVSRDGVQRTGAYEVAEENPSRWPAISRRAVLVVVAMGALYGLVVLVRSLLSGP